MTKSMGSNGLLMTENTENSTEIIAVASGKGGTGKTLISACLAYALIKSGHRVLVLDSDRGTDGLSLFMLGPDGRHQVDDFGPENTFSGFLEAQKESRPVDVTPRRINRTGKGDQEVYYNALISSKGMYASIPYKGSELADTYLNPQEYQAGLRKLYEQLRSSGKYDYVIVDTRGGFAFESADACALADSFVVVTEADYTSFYQDRNLVRRINDTASKFKKKSFLRGIIVNKATEGEEKSFRFDLTREFDNLSFEDTYVVPLDLEAMAAYRTQQIPYQHSPASHFCYASLRAFAGIMKTVTVAWNDNQIKMWNDLNSEISMAIEKRNKEWKMEERTSARQARFTKWVLIAMPVFILACMIGVTYTARNTAYNIARAEIEVSQEALGAENAMARKELMSVRLSFEQNSADVKAEMQSLVVRMKEQRKSHDDMIKNLLKQQEELTFALDTARSTPRRFEILFEAIMPMLIHGVANAGDTAARLAAVRALGAFGADAHVAASALVAALEDDDDELRRAAIDALGQIGEGAVPALIEALRHSNANVRRGAAQSLESIGPDAQEAMKALDESLRDEDVAVRDAAASALRAIGGKGSR